MEHIAMSLPNIIKNLTNDLKPCVRRSKRVSSRNVTSKTPHNPLIIKNFQILEKPCYNMLELVMSHCFRFEKHFIVTNNSIRL